MIQRSVRAFVALGSLGNLASTPKAAPSYANHGADWTMGSCASRDVQSPVNFDTSLVDPPEASFQFHYPIVRNVTIARRDGGLQANLRAVGGEIKHDGDVYKLIRLVWHSQAEHLIEGRRYPLELQLIHVHPFTPAALLTISVLFNVKGPANIVFKAPPTGADIAAPIEVEQHFSPNVAAFWDAVANDETDVTEFDIGAIIGEPAPGKTEATFIEYVGSQSSPPCMEGVKWLVKREVQSMGKSQMEAFAQTLHRLTNNDGNFRAVAPLNSRRLRVFRAQRVDGPLVPDEKNSPLSLGPNARTDSEFRTLRWAQKAAHTAEEAQEYVADFRNRLRRSAKAYQNAVSADLSST